MAGRELPTYEDALQAVLARARVLPVEPVPLDAAAGRVLREMVTADRDQPPFDRAAMDGFAVRGADVAPGAAFDVVADIAAGAGKSGADLARGVARIATGAAVPEAYDAVIQVELAHVESERVRFDVDCCAPGRNIHTRASDARAGDVVLREGQRLGGPQVGIAAAVGHTVLRVTRRPRVVLLTTGDEVLPPDTADPQPHQIRNSNGPMLAALLAGWGVPTTRHAHVRDDAHETLDAARAALADADLVLTTGGVSAGQRDFLPDTWRTLGLRTVLHGVRMQPGRPLFVAQAGNLPEAEADAGPLVLGLPGNPVSVLMTATLFARPLLRKMLGLDPALPWRPRKLLHDAKPNAQRELFRAATLTGDERIGLVDWHGSGDLAHTAAMQGIARLPMQDGPVPAGATVMYLSVESDAP